VKEKGHIGKRRPGQAIRQEEGLPEKNQYRTPWRDKGNTSRGHRVLRPRVVLRRMEGEMSPGGDSSWARPLKKPEEKDPERKIKNAWYSTGGSMH